jgi:hypothetical protein
MSATTLKIVAMVITLIRVSVATINSYCDMVIFILKWTLRSHLDSILDILYMYIKVMR